MMASQPVHILLSSFSAVEKKSTKEMVVSNSIRSEAIHIGATGNVTSGISECLRLAMDHNIVTSL